MLKLIDERLRNEIIAEGLENIIAYLGEGFENCKDEYDFNEILDEVQGGWAGYKVLNNEIVFDDSEE